MSQYPEKKPSGRANFVWVLGGGYLVYTAYKLIRDLINGQSEMYALSIVTAVIFAAVGGWMLWREWKAYKYGKDHIDDPSTWSLDDDEELPEGNTGMSETEIAEKSTEETAEVEEPEEENA